MKILIFSINSEQRDGKPARGPLEALSFPLPKIHLWLLIFRITLQD